MAGGAGASGWPCGQRDAVAGRFERRAVVTEANICAGPFGALYDFYIERPRLMRLIGRAVWGIDAGLLYEAMEPIASIGGGATVVDVPCGGGVAFRALRPEQHVRYLADDISPRMRARAERRALARGLAQVEVVEADMTALPFPDASADLIVCFSGLHMIHERELALREIVRCLRPGGRLIGTVFVADGSRRAGWLFRFGARGGHTMPPTREVFRRAFANADLSNVAIGSQPGFVAFSARRESSEPR